MFKKIIILAGLAALLAWGCSSDSPTGGGGGDQDILPLAGGGRLTGDDPFTGHHGADSGGYPHNRPPDIPAWPDSVGGGWSVLFYSEVDCAKLPGTSVITDAESWQTWWDEAHSCLNYRDTSVFSPKISGDTSWTDTIPPSWHGNPWDWQGEQGPPEVDFDHYIVATIRVEYDSGGFCLRNVNVTNVGVEGGEFVIHYEVSQLNQSCCDMIMAPFIRGAGSPTIAIMLEKPTEPIRFDRTDAEFSCFAPDPDVPLTLYFTINNCDLGDHTQLITDDATWEQWWSTTRRCDILEWDDIIIDSTTEIDHPGMGMEGDDPMPHGEVWPMPSWDKPEVDFSQYAVIILRGEPQDHWGGGIWLDNYTNGDAGAVVEYTVVEPGESCPPILAPLPTAQPTVAIRVPRPTNDQVTWQGTTKTVDCVWAVDTTRAFPM